MRLIDADALKEPLTDEYKKLNDVFNETSVFKAPNDVALYGALMQEVGAVIGAIDEAPTADAVPVRHGRWSRHTLGSTGGYGTTVMHQCSECESMTISKFRYCPNCGARMDGEE